MQNEEVVEASEPVKASVPPLPALPTLPSVGAVPLKPALKTKSSFPSVPTPIVQPVAMDDDDSSSESDSELTDQQKQSKSEIKAALKEIDRQHSQESVKNSSEGGDSSDSDSEHEDNPASSGFIASNMRQSSRLIDESEMTETELQLHRLKQLKRRQSITSNTAAIVAAPTGGPSQIKRRGSIAVLNSLLATTSAPNTAPSLAQLSDPSATSLASMLLAAVPISNTHIGDLSASGGVSIGQDVDIVKGAMASAIKTSEVDAVINMQQTSFEQKAAQLSKSKPVLPPPLSRQPSNSSDTNVTPGSAGSLPNLPSLPSLPGLPPLPSLPSLDSIDKSTKLSSSAIANVLNRATSNVPVQKTGSASSLSQQNTEEEDIGTPLTPGAVKKGLSFSEQFKAQRQGSKSLITTNVVASTQQAPTSFVAMLNKSNQMTVAQFGASRAVLSTLAAPPVVEKEKENNGIRCLMCFF
jgi:hypothetical protein